ncbi:MAG: endo-1,3-alpha-glucanase family glycosylhydrolase [Pseudonocardiales bacterium]
MTRQRRSLAAVAIVIVALPLTVLGLAEHAAGAADTQTTVTLSSVADTYGNAQQPTTPQGGKTYAFGTTTVNQAFVKFETTGVTPPGGHLTSAAVVLFTRSNRAIEPGLLIHPASSAWDEATLTASQRPPYQADVLNDSISSPAGQAVSVPLTTLSAINLTSRTSFEIRYSVPDSSYMFDTREGAHPPQLVLSFRFDDSTSSTASPSTRPSTPSTTTAPSTSSSSKPITTVAESTPSSPSPSSGTTTPTTTTPATTTPATTTPTTSASQPPDTGGVLPFDMPNTDRSAKMVFAHYFTPYPISLDNEPGVSDYYATEYLDPAGEGGRNADSGGLLRDRPLLRAPLGGDWQLTDAETEVREAVSAGIDGFTLDLLSTGGRHWDRDLRMMDAAANVDSSFRIMPMPDMYSMQSVDSATLASMLATLAAKSSAYKLSDGRLVVSPFKAEARSADWWTTTFNLLKSKYGISVAFVPTFVDFGRAADYRAISYGYSVWGGGSPSSVSASNGDTAHSQGMKWMQPVRVQDERPNQNIYDEAKNLATLRASWDAALNTDADWVQLTTWNDYSEGTSFAPSVQHGWTFLDVSSYYVNRFKSGAYPAVVRDAVYVTHRTQMYDAQPTYPQTSLMVLRSGSSPAVNEVEVTSFLVDSSTVTARVGATTFTWTAPSGMSTHVVPLTYGTVSVSASRGGRVMQATTSPYLVTAEPWVQDLQYHGVSSRR